MRTIDKTSAPSSPDRGAVLVLVALIMTTLLGVGALTIDLGALYSERRQLQNGADAAALAVAQDCAQGSCLNSTSTAKNYADLNSHDGVSGIDYVCGSAPGASPALAACTDPAPPAVNGASGWVQVRTSTLEKDGGTRVKFLLAPIMNSVTDKNVTAKATVAWGPAGSASVIPLVFSECQYAGLDGSLNPANPIFPVGPRTITFHGVGGTKEADVPTCHITTSGLDLPGGFGYFGDDKKDTTCLRTVSAGALTDPSSWVISDTGNSFPKYCDPDAWLNNDVVIAVFDKDTGSGSTGQYHIVGFVGFRLLGYKFQGNNLAPAGFKCLDPSGNPYTNSVVCLYGEFKRVPTDGGSWGGADLGARVIKMVG